MKVSLVMATYNGHDYLIEQLDSIKNQTRRFDEVIIVDDVSKDDTVILIKDYLDKYQLDWKLIENDVNLGYRDNFKKGLSLASGDIVFLSDQDDRFHLDKVERMISIMEDNDNIKSLASSFNFIDSDSKLFTIEQKKGYSNQNIIHKELVKELEQIDFSLIKVTNISQGCTMAIKKDIIDIYIKNTNGLYPHDWELNLISAMQDGCYFYNVPLIDYRIHGNNTIGLDNVINDSQSELMKNRTLQRLKYIDEEICLMENLLDIDKCNKDIKDYILGHIDYSKNRKDYISNKAIFSLFVMYIKGQYRTYGTLKTLLGDICSILYK